MKITVDITNTDFEAYLTAVAEKTTLTIAEYVTNIVNGWIESHVRGHYAGYAKVAPMDELRTKLGDIITVIAIKEQLKTG